VIPSIDFETIRFEQPQYLWLLIAPAVLLVLWFWQAGKRRGDTQRLLQHRMVPVRERFQFFGGLLFWLCAILATASTIVALARPHARVSLMRTAGIDLVILQDGSTSMRVRDVPGDRWTRSMRFLRQLGESIRWKDDRIAMALFARIATPQVRLTKDPNTYFFFLDHLRESPFPLEEDTSWDTNIELGINWGLKLIDRDELINGKSPNARAFILLSDGQSWSGAAEEALEQLKTRRIPLHAIGVGTSSGGPIPNPPSEEVLPVIFSVLDRPSLAAMATATGGQYFEMDRDSDRDIINRIVDATRRRAPFQGVEEGIQPLYWRFLFAAAILLCVGVLFLHERVELAIQVAGASVVLLIIGSLTG
jgi:Ca-activated chloride channel family protein